MRAEGICMFLRFIYSEYNTYNILISITNFVLQKYNKKYL